MDTKRTVSSLLTGLEFECLAGDVETCVAQVRTDSRSVQPGDLFVCLPGYRTEGGESRADRHEFAHEAAQRGAVAIVVERAVALPDGITVIRVDDGWLAAATVACARFGHPSRALTMVGITGTSGKTSTSYFIESLLSAAGRRPARFGTIDYSFAGHCVTATQTTPESDELQRLLRLAVDEGLDACVMEVSSHALELRRVAGIAFDVAVFTNLSQDHLNFHPDMHAYLRAKGRLFQELESGGKRATAVVNADDPHSDYIVAANRGSLLSYGITAAADVRASQLRTGLDGSRFRVESPIGNAEIRLEHLGEYQVHNALAAFGVGVALGIDRDQIVAGIEATPGIPGRFEIIPHDTRFRVAVDYAHKPDALERLLQTARGLDPRRVIVVFGCGGDRDRGKRPIMGRIASDLADVVIITSDNPRSEDPDEIIAAIAAGVTPSRQCEILIEPDRARAIRLAIDLAGDGDLVLIAGKGHETYQLLGDRRIDFDDREHARRALAARAV